MGHVYRVRHNVLNAEYALKMLSREQATESAARLFQREAGAIKILSHPNLVRIYDVGLHGGKLPYYAMELLVGRDLAKIIRDTGPIAPMQAASIFKEVCAGLEYVHARGIVHRDIKPSNILLLEKPGSSGERVKIVDFGIVSFITTKRSDDQTEDVHGTPMYMSPEQCMGKTVDARSDIYSLGCTMFEALTGNVPFNGKTPTDTMKMHLRDAAPTLREKADGKEFPEAWETIIAKTMAKDPADRYQTMDEISNKLSEILSIDKLSTAAPGVSINGKSNNNQSGSAASEMAKRKTLLIGAGAVVGLAVLLALGFGHSHEPAPPAGVKAEQSTTTKPAAEVMAPQTGPASLTSTKPFASDVIDGGKMVRKFDLPTDVLIGWFRTRQSDIPVKASGELKYPTNVHLTFTPSDIVGKYPFCLRRFQPDDIRGLKFDPTACTDQIFKATARFRGVRKLSIADCKQLTAASCETLKSFQNLSSFDASNTNFTGPQLAQAGIWSKIDSLTLSSANNIGPLLKQFDGTKHLQRLVVSNSKLTSAEIKAIAKLTELRELDISQNKLSKQDATILSALNHMTDLHLAATGLTGADLELFKDMKYLTYLDFSGNHMTSKDLANLTNMFECTELDLRDTDLNASIVENLRGYGSLKKLHIGSAKLKAGDLKKIKDGLPLVQVD